MSKIFVNNSGKIFTINNAIVSDSINSGSTIYTDNFEAYSVGSLGGQGNWVNALNSLAVVDNTGNKQVEAVVLGAVECCVRRSETFANDHYAKVTFATSIGVGGSYIGPAVRCSTNNYYAMYAQSDIVYFGKVLSGSWNAISSASVSSSVGDVFEIRATGTTIRCLKNGSAISGIGDANGDTTDNSLSSGSPGITGYASGAITHGFIDNFECTAAS